jgi:carboxyl-terminal processing protease
MNIAGGPRWSDRGNPPRRRVRGYLMGALELIRRNALFSDSVDWDAVHQQAQDAVTHASGYAGTYHLLGTVVKQAGGHHSRFIPPAAFHQARARTAAAGLALPAGGIAGRVGYLVLPRLPGGQKHARRYIVAGSGLVDEMAAARPQGWIVDLRDNSGGNMWPMLAAVAGLLEYGVLGHFALPGGRMQAWSLDRRHVRLDGKRAARRHNHFRRTGGIPVAVLTSARTASAGEAVAVALRSQPRVRTFGMPTAGFTTGNHTHVLRDGARLVISECYYADHRQRLITGTITPDERVDGSDAGTLLAAARKWITASTSPP